MRTGTVTSLARNVDKISIPKRRDGWELIHLSPERLLRRQRQAVSQQGLQNPEMTQALESVGIPRLTEGRIN